MSVFRIEKTNNYTVMSNYHLREREMSLKAKGLLSLMLSLPNDWDYTIEGLVTICKENETAVKSTLNELKDFGYLEILKVQNKKGQFEYEYNIYEKPQSKKPEVENLGVENPSVENQGQLNTNKQNTKKTITKELKIQAFLEFWKAYPKKKAKQDAIKAFDKLAEEDYPLLIPAIELQKQTNDWKKENGKYIPHPATWLNGRRWEDEIDSVTVSDVEPKPLQSADDFRKAGRSY